MIYFLLHKPTNSVKIGKADLLLERLRELAASYPILSDFVLLGTKQGGLEEEHALHIEYGDYRIRCEWFKADGRLAEYLKQFENPRELDTLLPPEDLRGANPNPFWSVVAEETLQRCLRGRYLTIALRYKSGETMEQIAQSESCTRQRVHQILRSCRSQTRLAMLE